MTKYFLHKHSSNIHNLSFSNGSRGFPICKRDRERESFLFFFQHSAEEAIKGRATSKWLE